MSLEKQEFNFKEWDKVTQKDKEIVRNLLKEGLNEKVTDINEGEEARSIPKNTNYDELLQELNNKKQRGIVLLHKNKPVAFITGRYFEKGTVLVTHLVGFNTRANKRFFKRFGTMPSEALLRKLSVRRKKKYNIISRNAATKEGLRFFERLEKKGILERKRMMSYKIKKKFGIMKKKRHGKK